MSGEETTGAEADIRRATELARAMVGRFGMCEEIGFVSVLRQDGEAWAMPGLSPGLRAYPATHRPGDQ